MSESRTSPRTLRVAAVQVRSTDGEVEQNLARAETRVAEAASRGAKLVLCPEFLAAGYVYDVSLWRAGERQGGVTEAWLCRLAAAHGIYVGASYLEVDGDDFFNTFALAAPGGTLAGRVRKESLPAFEGWFFKSSDGPKVIDTELGRIGVGICHDNHTARFFARMTRDRPDLILMPHSAPCFQWGRELMRESLAEIGPHYARAFGVPTVVVNKASAKSRSPIPGVRALDLAFEFPGMSTISDSDGEVRGRLPDEEGIVVADVTLDASRRRSPEGAAPFYWSLPPRRFPGALGLMFMALERLGKRAYGRSRSRVRAARAHAP